MKIQETELAGVFLIDLAPIEDERGYFARSFCVNELSKAGLVSKFVQGNTSLSHSKGTMRGLHYQLPPHSETKLVRCIKGAIFDVVLDLRENSPTYMRSHGFTLTQNNHTQLYVPEGFAHGFLTLQDDSVATYLVSAFYTPDCERGLRWDDPALTLDWPTPVVSLSDKDASWPDYSKA